MYHRVKIRQFKSVVTCISQTDIHFLRYVHITLLSWEYSLCLPVTSIEATDKCDHGWPIETLMHCVWIGSHYSSGVQLYCLVHYNTTSAICSSFPLNVSYECLTLEQNGC